MPFFSICVAVYNPGEKLRRCLDSILSQSFTDFELLACDDKSTDGSLEILREYAARDSRVKVYENEANGGCLITMNRLFRLATGQYSMWMDSDDYLSQGCFAEGYRILAQRPSDILEFPYEIINSETDREFATRPYIYIKGRHLSHFFLDRNRPYVWYMWSKFIRTKVIQKSLPPDVHVCIADVFFGLQVFHNATSYQWADLKEPMYHYLNYNGSWTAYTREISLEKFHDICKTRALELAYNYDFFVREKLNQEMLIPIINLVDLESIPPLIAAMPVEKQIEALKIFFSYFCKGERGTLLNHHLTPILAQPVLDRLKKNLPKINPEWIDKRMELQ